MARYLRKSTVVEAFQVGTNTNLGALGTSLVSTDWVLLAAAGGLSTLSAASMTAKFDQTNDGAVLTGTDVT